MIRDACFSSCTTLGLCNWPSVLHGSVLKRFAYDRLTDLTAELARKTDPYCNRGMAVLDPTAPMVI